MSFIEDNLSDMNVFFTKDMVKVMDKASRRATPRAYTTMEKKALGKIKARYSSMNKTNAKKSFVRRVNTKGSIEKHEASILFKHKPISAINFMSKGQRAKSKDQKGKEAGKRITYPKRFKIKVNIDGKKVHLKRAFVRDGKSGNEHVFRRSGKTQKWRKVSFSSAHFLFNSKAETKVVTVAGWGRYNSEFADAFNFLYAEQLRKRLG